MDEDRTRKVKALLESFPPAPDVDALIESGDLLKVSGRYQAPTEKSRNAIARHTVGFIYREGNPPVYRLCPSVRRKRKANN